MQHTIPLTQWAERIGPQVEEMAHAVEACVHCGFCLPTCPTYQVLGEEMDSPRGRIMLMKSTLEGALSIQDTLPYIDRCLGCLSCVTACPSGVQYNELVTPFRAYAQNQVAHNLMDRVQRTLVNETLPYPDRFRSAATIGRLVRPLRHALPEKIQNMLTLLPDRLPVSRPLPPVMPAEGQRRARVALLVGCVQQVLSPEINWATLRVLTCNGVEVIIPPDQACCGALSMHIGDESEARHLARQNLRAFPDDVDAILTNAAGCGSGMKEYGMLFKGQSEEEQARAFALRTRDVSEFLVELGLLEPPALLQPLKVAYHDACHLAHAQGITDAPRRLLAAIPNLTLLEFEEGDMCCGSAGTYNLAQPDIANELGDRKVGNILDSSCDAVAAGNIGCLVQIEAHLQKVSPPPPVYHTLELLDMAYAQEKGS